jgi:hypothetical protein
MIQELLELDGPVALGELVEHRPAGEIECGIESIVPWRT